MALDSSDDVNSFCASVASLKLPLLIALLFTLLFYHFFYYFHYYNKTLKVLKHMFSTVVLLALCETAF